MRYDSIKFPAIKDTDLKRIPAFHTSLKLKSILLKLKMDEKYKNMMTNSVGVFFS